MWDLRVIFLAAFVDISPLDPDPWIHLFVRIRIQEAKILWKQRIRILGTVKYNVQKREGETIWEEKPCACENFHLTNFSMNIYQLLLDDFWIYFYIFLPDPGFTKLSRNYFPSPNNKELKSRLKTPRPR